MYTQSAPAAVTAPSAGPTSGTFFQSIGSLLRQTGAWLDSRGRGAWIAAMILGFIFFWPVGLAIVFYMTATKRWSKKTMFGHHSCNHDRSARWAAMRAMRPSGNSAFDAYKADTLKRLEDEQQAFEAFLQRLRDAKDKQEFDAFMDDRAKGAANSGNDSPRGEY